MLIISTKPWFIVFLGDISHSLLTFSHRRYHKNGDLEMNFCSDDRTS